MYFGFASTCVCVCLCAHKHERGYAFGSESYATATATKLPCSGCKNAEAQAEQGGEKSAMRVCEYPS